MSTARNAAQPAGRLDAASLAALGGLGGALCLASAAFTADATDELALAARNALAIGIPIATGLFAWQRTPYVRFGKLLVIAGAGWSLGTFAVSPNPVLYSFGRLCAYVLETGMLYLVLSFPYGRLEERFDRALVWAAAAVLTILYLLTAPVVDGYPEPSPWSTCGSDCPENAFLVLSSEPGFVPDLLEPLREFLAMAIFVAVVVRLAQRVRGATPPMRRTLTPMLAVAIFRGLAITVGFGVRRADPGADALDAIVWVIAVTLPAIAVGFLVGLQRWLVFSRDALDRLSGCLASRPGPAGLRNAVAETLGDPSVELLTRAHSGDSWRDVEGRPAKAPEPGSVRCLTEVQDIEGTVAGIVHDAALRDQRRLVVAVGAYVLTALDNQRLRAQVETAMRRLNSTRSRLLTAADDERRRIERDLHDGAQQHLVALRMGLGMIDDVLKTDPVRSRAMLRDIAVEAEEAVEHVRSLAAGVYPPLLLDLGLGEALNAVTEQARLPVTVDPGGIGRYPREVEAAVYFCCLEAVQNATKHAHTGTSVSVSLSEEGGTLRFQVRDDGPGFSIRDAPRGAGLANMRDRVEAVGGMLAIDSAPGTGTIVSGFVPLER